MSGAGKFGEHGARLSSSLLKPNQKNEAFSDEHLLASVIDLMLRLGRFPNNTDLNFEANNNASFPRRQTIGERWKQFELAVVINQTALLSGDMIVAGMAQKYIDANQKLLVTSTCNVTDRTIKSATRAH